MAEPLRLSSRPGRGTLLTSVVASGMAFLDSTVVNIALPHLGKDLHATIAGLQWTVNGYTLVLAAFVLVGGSLGDRYGHRATFLVGISVFTAASILCGFATSVSMLIASRVLQGAGAALLVPNSLALLQASFDQRDRGRAIGAWSGLSGVSTAIGPFLGGWLIDALSWRWIFFINVPLAAIAVALAVRFVPETKEPPELWHPFDMPGAVLGAVGLGGITYALTQRGGIAMVCAVVGAAALAGFVIWERRRGEAAMLPTRLFASRQFVAINLVTLTVYAGLSAVFFFLIVELQVVAGFSARIAGISLLPASLLLLVGSPRAGALSARIGPRWPMVVGTLIATAGVLLLLRVGPETNYLTDVLPGAVVFGLGMTLVVAPLTTSVMAAAPTELAGSASGVSNAVARAGGLLAIAALPLLVGLSGQGYQQPPELNRAFHQAVWYSALLLVTGTVLSLVLVRSHPPAPAEPQLAPVDRAHDGAQ